VIRCSSRTASQQFCLLKGGLATDDALRVNPRHRLGIDAPASVVLCPMSIREISIFLARSNGEYINERVAWGDDVERATREAAEQTHSVFPNGKPAPGHRLFRVECNGVAVGVIWIGPLRPEQPTCYWVWDVVIDEAHRAQGFGRAAMLLAEQEARAAGATELGLNVVDTNTIARRLYASLGYAPTSTHMSKRL
jgi:GNAT superfamily N-acetyltransferase